ncbi:hypothetical protein [Arthrobacter sp. UM1]|uniref:hypothetical protein n=1 Tax=Arthrobacter sp. UM1 TaxID=2766776 RepID=UPI001CF67537|nr:hypothetical protein [Arthrobacter sp. UM1]MCB4207368.1 hypothetical protein [Arthrobacter sp. UM1]
MGKHTSTAVLFAALAMAAVACFILHSTVLALVFAAGAVLLWAFTPSSALGRPPRRRNTASPAELKRYREEHPGATISDAVDALSK